MTINSFHFANAYVGWCKTIVELSLRNYIKNDFSSLLPLSYCKIRQCNFSFPHWCSTRKLSIVPRKHWKLLSAFDFELHWLNISPTINTLAIMKLLVLTILLLCVHNIVIGVSQKITKKLSITQNTGKFQSSGTFEMKAPDLNDEEFHSSHMPDHLKCDSCRAISYQVGYVLCCATSAMFWHCSCWDAVIFICPDLSLFLSLLIISFIFCNQVY